MVLFNYSTKELTAKVVYYGPGLCGKTTNLQWIHEKLPIKNKGKMLSLATETDRTLFFDFLPIELGTIRGMRTRIQLYTVPGQVFYNATRRMVLKGADCLVFVCDSQEPILEANIESLENLRQNLEANEIDPDEIPMVLQYNKRDLPNALPIEILGERLNERELPFYEAVAIKGIGVEETLKGATALVFRSLAARYGGPPIVTEAVEAPEVPAPSEETPAPEPAPLPSAAPRRTLEVASEKPLRAAKPVLDEVPDFLSESEEEHALAEATAEDEDFLEGLELQPTSEGIDDDETRAVSEPEVVEESELSIGKSEDMLPFEEEEFDPEGGLARKAPVADTQEREPDEAAALRRRIADEGVRDVRLDTIEEAMEGPIQDEDIDEEEAEQEEEDVEEEDIDEDEEEEIALPSSPPSNWPAEVKVGDATLISFEDALMREALKKYSQAPPAPTPSTVDVDLGTVDVAVPVDVELQDGATQVQITLHLTLNLKPRR
jgi:signal recognition particle receptor subunit beta